MIDDKYARLGAAEQETFSRVINRLLACTFLLADEYIPSEGISRTNRDYLFVERNFELFSDYLALSGFHLEKDTGYGVIYLASSFDGNRVHFDKLSTVMTYTLRLIYEEERAKLHLSNEVIVTTADLVNKMITVGAVKKKPANDKLHGALRKLSRFQIIEKLDGAFEAPDTRLLILPTILFVVSNEQISNMAKLVEQDASAAAHDEDDMASAYEDEEESYEDA
ncbi:MAG: DUF4194 domain-containing protein [Lachnospiraceae bacterium]|nr:DUF4194 domain-containing protein [Lachnospiraceae bacterium]